LSTSTRRYDVILVGPMRIWLAGSSRFYNREFYRLAKSRLRPSGVLEQRMPLERVGVDDLVSMLATVRSEFARVWLYDMAKEGVLVACDDDCAPTPSTIAAVEASPDFRGPMFEGAKRLVADRLLTPERVDRFLAELAARGLSTDALVSTDDNLFLEQNTPRGNVRERESSLQNNLALLRLFSPSSMLDGTHLTEQDLAAEPETTPVERPGLTREAGHGKTER
jgi:hypothetical protein